MIVITSKSYDPQGVLTLDTKSTLGREERRRTAVTATLDGGAVIDDAGWSATDTARVYLVLVPTQSQVERALRLVTIHNEHYLYDGDNAYSGVLFDYQYDPPELQLRFQIESDLT